MTIRLPRRVPVRTVELLGLWNAATNTPPLADGIGDRGDTFVVSVGGTIDLGSGAFTVQANDKVYFGPADTWLVEYEQVSALPSLTEAAVLFGDAAGNIDEDVSKLAFNIATGRLGVGTGAGPFGFVDIRGANPGSLGGGQSGHLVLRSTSVGNLAKVGVSGHDGAGGGFDHLWYLGALSVSDQSIILANTKNAALFFATNTLVRLTIDGAGNAEFHQGLRVNSVIANVTDPVADQDAATKKFVEDQKVDARDVQTIVNGALIGTALVGLVFSVPSGAASDTDIVLAAGGKFEVVGMDVRAGGAGSNGDTLQLLNTAAVITDAIDMKSAVLGDIFHPNNITAANAVIVDTGTARLRSTTSGSFPGALVVVWGIRRA